MNMIRFDESMTQFCLILAVSLQRQESCTRGRLQLSPQLKRTGLPVFYSLP